MEGLQGISSFLWMIVPVRAICLVSRFSLFRVQSIPRITFLFDCEFAHE